MSSEGWETHKLGYLLGEKGYVRGPFGSSLKRGEMKPNGIPVYEQQHAIYNNRDFRYYVDDEKFFELRRFQVKTNDLIVSCSGTIGKISIISGEDPKGIISQALLILRPDNTKVLPEYLKYYFTTREGYNNLVSTSHGSVQINIASRDVVENITIEVPDIPTQHRIAEILSALDDKIELNRQTNATLEAIAQAIFKEWFVDFNFPGATGEMVESELGMIPRGWRVGKLGEVCKFIKGVSYKSSELQPSTSALVTLKSINRGGGFNFNGFKEYTGRYKASQILEEGDLVFAQTDITQNADIVGSPAIVENPLGYEILIASLDIVKCKPANEMPGCETLLYFLQSQEFKDYCLSHTNGSTVLHLRSSEVPNYSFLIPNANLLSKFDSMVTPFRQNILSNNRQTQILGAIRDALLPKLISGEIEV